MQALFEIILYKPLFNAFIALYNLIPDVGFVIIAITILIKVLLYPLTSASLKAQQSLADLQPKLDAIKQEHKGNQQRIAEETMKLYKDHKVNPFGSCLPLLLQIPIFLSLYWVFKTGLTNANFDLLYSFVQNPGSLHTVAFGIVDLKEVNVILALLAGIAQFWQARLLYRKQPPRTAGEGGKDESMMAIMNKQMLFVMPIMTFFISLSLPSGLALYWFFSTVLTGLQQLLIQKKKSKEGIVVS